MHVWTFWKYCRGLTADAADPEVVEPDVVTDVVVVDYKVALPETNRYQNCLTRVPTDS